MRNATLLATLGLLSFASPAFAESEEPCTKAAKEQWLSNDQIKAKLGEQGFTIKKVETEDGCAEAEGTDKDGNKVELHADPATARIIEKDD